MIDTKNISFLGLVKQFSEGTDSETDGLDFDDSDADMDVDTDDELDDDLEDADIETGMSGDEVTITLPVDVAQQLIDVLQAAIGGSTDDELEDDELEDDSEDDTLEDDSEGDTLEDDSFDEEEESIDDSMSEEEEEDEDMAEEDEEELHTGTSSSVTPAGVSRQGSPKISKSNKGWNTGKTVKSVFDKTASGEGTPAGVGRDGAPKRSKSTGGWYKDKTVRGSKLNPPKNIFDLN